MRLFVVLLFALVVFDAAAPQTSYLSKAGDAPTVTPSLLLLPWLESPTPFCKTLVPACKLTNSMNISHSPVWSPDGNKIAFARVASRPEDLPYAGMYVIDTRSGEEVHFGEFDAWPAWSPDGTKIAFMRGGLYVMNADGSQVVEVGENTDRAQSLVWSPDGTKIAYQYFTIADMCCDTAGALYVINVDGSQRIKLADEVTLTRPSWSPDSTKIAAGVYRNDGTLMTDIYVIDADGKNSVNVTNDGLNNLAAVWSPDGSKIAFTGIDNALEWHLFVMNPDGSHMVKRSRKASRADPLSAPVWSPDSRKLYYISSLEPTGRQTGIFVVDAEGDEEARFVFSAAESIGGQLSLSRDGRKLAFAAGMDIYVLGLEE